MLKSFREAGRCLALVARNCRYIIFIDLLKYRNELVDHNDNGDAPRSLLSATPKDVSNGYLTLIFDREASGLHLFLKMLSVAQMSYFVFRFLEKR